jgi:hypothetical protein
VKWSSADSSVDEDRGCPACARTAELTLVEVRETDNSSIVASADANGDLDGNAVVPVTGESAFLKYSVCNLYLERNELKLFPELNRVIELVSEFIEAPSPFDDEG